MAKQTRHTLDKSRSHSEPPPVRAWDKERPEPRVYQGEDAGTRVTTWLNGHQEYFEGKNSAASRERVVDLMNNLREVIDVMQGVAARFDWMNNPSPERFDELTLELCNRLAEYPTIPAFSPDYGQQWIIEAAVAGRRPPGESVAAHAIIELAKQNLLDRIDQCVCGKWYFARFLHQRCCSATCRRKIYEKTSDFREKRRKYMRKYYRLKNSGKVK